MRKESNSGLLEVTPSPAAQHRASPRMRVAHDERRADRRLDVRLPVQIRSVDADPGASLLAISRNVSSSGAFVELQKSALREGERIHVTLQIPPMEGVSPYNQRAECEARVLRIRDDSGSGKMESHVAIKFLDRLRFS